MCPSRVANRSVAYCEGDETPLVFGKWKAYEKTSDEFNGEYYTRIVTEALEDRYEGNENLWNGLSRIEKRVGRSISTIATFPSVIYI